METVDISHIKISSMAAPTEEDMKIYNALSPKEKRALILHEIDKGAKSGISTRSMDDIRLEAMRQLGQLSNHEA